MDSGEDLPVQVGRFVDLFVRESEASHARPRRKLQGEGAHPSRSGQGHGGLPEGKAGLPPQQRDVPGLKGIEKIVPIRHAALLCSFYSGFMGIIDNTAILEALHSVLVYLLQLD